MHRPPKWPVPPTKHALSFLRAASCVAAILTLGACEDESFADCQTTYRHLLTVAHKNHTPEAMNAFMSACTDHYDPKRLDCLRQTETPGAALACKPHKKRPD